MRSETVAEARRQIEICNACRYCEGYCAVFPALMQNRSFAEADIAHLANLCHNCRGCYYACQYTAPHEFALNLPGILAEASRETWRDHAWPAGFARLFERSGLVIALGLIVTFAFLFGLAQAVQPEGGEGFYAVLSHSAMVAVFLPAFLFPILAMAVSVRRYWLATGGGGVSAQALVAAIRSAGELRNLTGGHGEGCNFEDEDRFSQARRYLHLAVVAGFLLCFAATAIGTVMHYAFDLPAPYGLLSLPKLFGLPGGVLLCAGTAGLAWLKLNADPRLGAKRAWGGEMAFVMLLFLVSASGLVLYGATGSGWVATLLPVHLATVLTFFLLMPYSKMVHGLYRLAALVREAGRG